MTDLGKVIKDVCNELYGVEDLDLLDDDQFYAVLVETKKRVCSKVCSYCEMSGFCPEL